MALVTSPQCTVHPTVRRDIQSNSTHVALALTVFRCATVSAQSALAVSTWHAAI